MNLSDHLNIEINGKEFTYICKSDDVLEGHSKKIQFDDDIDLQFAVFRIDNQLFCVSNICPHRHATKIFEGYIKDKTVTCPLHGWTYSLVTGENTNKHQGIKTLAKYEIFEKSGKIFMEKPLLKVPKWRQGLNISGGQNSIFD